MTTERRRTASPVDAIHLPAVQVFKATKQISVGHMIISIFSTLSTSGQKHLTALQQIF